MEVSTLGYEAELIGSAALVMDNMIRENRKLAYRDSEKVPA
jgi:hypothetical protein